MIEHIPNGGEYHAIEAASEISWMVKTCTAGSLVEGSL